MEYSIGNFYQVQQKARTVNYLAKVLIAQANALKTVWHHRGGEMVRNTVESGIEAIEADVNRLLYEMQALMGQDTDVQYAPVRQFFVKINYRMGIVRVGRTSDEDLDRRSAIDRFEEASNETWSNSNMDCVCVEIKPSQYPQPYEEGLQEFHDVIVLG